MIFRWTIWGDKNNNLELLKYSILSFKKFFGENNRYIVFTDDKKNLNDISNIAEVFEFEENNLFNINSVATWKKWCPIPRIDMNEHESYIDSDVFLVSYPTEIFDFLKDNKSKFAILDEFKGQSWQHGAMNIKANKDTPFINAGLFIQKSGFDITKNLLLEFNWWRKNIKSEDIKHHDEQGALAIALTKYKINNELCILPKEKYILIGPNENKDIESLENITLFHAVYPEHPAFYKFKNVLDKILYE